MLHRITRDVLRRAVAGLWQTGVDDVIARVKVADFKRTLVAGIDMMKAAEIDFVLIDQQYYPEARGLLPQFAAYVVAMREAAAEKGIPVLKRYAMMEQLIASHRFAAGDLLASDGFHLNDRSYACLGAMIADALRVRSAVRRWPQQRGPPRSRSRWCAGPCLPAFLTPRASPDLGPRTGICRAKHLPVASGPNCSRELARQCPWTPRMSAPREPGCQTRRSNS